MADQSEAIILFFFFALGSLSLSLSLSLTHTHTHTSFIHGAVCLCAGSLWPYIQLRFIQMNTLVPSKWGQVAHSKRRITNETNSTSKWYGGDHSNRTLYKFRAPKLSEPKLQSTLFWTSVYVQSPYFQTILPCGECREVQVQTSVRRPPANSWTHQEVLAPRV
jgi:hypothetical protein